MRKLFFLCILFCTASISHTWAQPQIIDRIVSIVGEDIILQSDVENQFNYLITQGEKDDGTLKCSILEQLIVNKLLLNKAVQDSLVVDDGQVEAEVDRRIGIFTQQLGSREALEKAYNKTLIDIRRDLRPEIRDQLLMEQMKSQILNSVTVTPKEVKEFFKAIPADSLPYLPAEVELYHIVIKPPYSKEAKDRALADLQKIYEMANSPDKEFGALAKEYSMGPSAEANGYLGEFNRGQMVPEFDDVIFNLKEGDVSEPFETDFGYHVAKLHKRLGNKVSASHILIIPERGFDDDALAMTELSRIREYVMKDSGSFETSAQEWSQDQSTKDCGGCIRNPQTGELRIPLDLLDADLFFKVDNMKEGDISEPMQLIQPNSTDKLFHILYLKSKIPPHKANLRDDYQKLANAAKQNKQLTELDRWLQKAKGNIFIDIKDESCTSALKNWN